MSTTNRTQYVILGLLTFGPAAGYDLKKEIDRSVGFFWQESYGQLYPTLARLADEGLIELDAEDPEGRRRKVYRISEAGRAALREWLAEPPAAPPVRNELLLKLFLGNNVSDQILIDHLERARDHFKALRRTYTGIAEELDAIADPSRADVLGRLTLSFGEHRVAAGEAWVEEALAALRSLEGGSGPGWPGDPP